jgi:hypothetical protein
MALEARFATALVDAWDAGRSSLRQPLEPLTHSTLAVQG